MDDVGHENNCVGRARLMEHLINRIERHVQEQARDGRHRPARRHVDGDALGSMRCAGRVNVHAVDEVEQVVGGPDGMQLQGPDADKRIEPVHVLRTQGSLELRTTQWHGARDGGRYSLFLFLW